MRVSSPSIHVSGLASVERRSIRPRTDSFKITTSETAASPDLYLRTVSANFLRSVSISSSSKVTLAVRSARISILSSIVRSLRFGRATRISGSSLTAGRTTSFAVNSRVRLRRVTFLKNWRSRVAAIFSLLIVCEELNQTMFYPIIRDGYIKSK